MLLRFLLGLGVTIGLVSIANAPNMIISAIQLFMGIGLYVGISIKRIKSKDSFKECETCGFHRSIDCPGFAPFMIPGSRPYYEKLEQEKEIFSLNNELEEEIEKSD